MKRILIYGDSLTWGRKTPGVERFDEDARYTQVFAKALGSDYVVVEEGLRARMLEGENPHFHDRDGLAQFGPIFGSHIPLDVVVIFLGTNDCNAKANKTPGQIADGLEKYFEQIKSWSTELETKEPEVVITSPPVIQEKYLGESTMFAGGEAKSKQLASLYAKVASNYDAGFFDAAKVVQSCEDDGVHLDAENNIKLGNELAEWFKKQKSR